MSYKNHNLMVFKLNCGPKQKECHPGFKDYMSLCWNIHSQSRLNEGTVKAMLPGHFYRFLIFILIYNITLHIDIN